MMKNEYRIGDWVSVSATVDFISEDEDRILLRSECKPFNAQIVGATRRQIGVHHGAVYDNYSEESPYFEQKGAFFVWKVTRGMLNKHIDVLPEDLEPIRDDNELPWLYSTPVECSDRYREFCRQAIKEMKRDSKGRLVKCL